MIFNSVKNHHESSTVVRHNEDKETPFPIYLGLMIHAVTRKRDIIDKLHKFGLSVSYDRVLQFSADLCWITFTMPDGYQYIFEIFPHLAVLILQYTMNFRMAILLSSDLLAGFHAWHWINHMNS